MSNTIETDETIPVFGVEEHPNYTLEDWRQDVANRITLLGYLEWLKHKLRS